MQIRTSDLERVQALIDGDGNDRQAVSDYRTALTEVRRVSAIVNQFDAEVRRMRHKLRDSIEQRLPSSSPWRISGRLVATGYRVDRMMGGSFVSITGWDLSVRNLNVRVVRVVDKVDDKYYDLDELDDLVFEAEVVDGNAFDENNRPVDEVVFFLLSEMLEQTTP